MTYHVDIQLACAEPLPFSEEQLITWAEQALKEHEESAELTLRIVDEEEITSLNNSYRKQNKATNVLAFPSSIPEIILLDLPLLGDVIICPAVLKQESIEQNKPLNEHWAHIIIHGVLHLIGYDHIKDEDALVMQALETTLLANLGFANPYKGEDNNVE